MRDTIPRLNAAFSLMNAVAHSSTFAARSCPLCGSTGNRQSLLRRDPWEIVECAECSMVFIGAEIPYRVQAVEHDWEEEWRKDTIRRKREQPVMVFLSRVTRPLLPHTHGRLLSQTLHYVRSGKLVDFGCSDASFLVRAQKYFQVTGIDLSPRSVEIARRRVGAEKIIEGPVTEAAERRLLSNEFDVVTQLGFIEHDWQPQSALRAAHRVLKPGGITVIKTPNYASWNRAIRGEKWCGYRFPAHVNYFTPETLAKMLRQCGFEPVPRPWWDRLPTSDSLWMAARKLA
ncbi:MAG: class I SAM-dependent methyltransferase [Candidatus Acidiferrales bacterium]